MHEDQLALLLLGQIKKNDIQSEEVSKTINNYMKNSEKLKKKLSPLVDDINKYGSLFNNSINKVLKKSLVKKK